MIDRVLFYSPTRTTYLTFNFREPYASDILITKIDGLSLTDTSLATADSGNGEGVSITAAHTEERNIVFYITINPEKDIEAVRRMLYDYFPNGVKITLFFVSGDRTYQIDGFCETVDADIFSALQTMQVSVICPEPSFKIVKLLEPPKITDGMLVQTHEPITETRTLSAKGNNPTWTGLYLQFYTQTLGVTGAVFTITFYKDAAGSEFNFKFGVGYGSTDDFNNAATMVMEEAGYANAMPNSKMCSLKILLDDTPVKANDKIVIDSRAGQKAVSLVRDGAIVCNLLKYAIRADFPVIHSGRNRMYITLNTSYTGLYMGDVEISAEIPLVCGGI